MQMTLTCDVDIVLLDLQDALSVVILQYDHGDGGDVAYSWRLVQLETKLSHCVVHNTDHQRETQNIKSLTDEE